MKKIIAILLLLSMTAVQEVGAELDFSDTANIPDEFGLLKIKDPLTFQKKNYEVARSLVNNVYFFPEEQHTILEVWSFIEQRTHTENVKGIDPVYLTVDHQWSF